MNISYLSNLFDSFKIDKGFQFIDFEFLYTEDKHYPGLKKIILTSRRNGYMHIERLNNLLYKEITYNEISKIFNPRLKSGMCSYFRNQIGEGSFHHIDAKHIKISIENDKEIIMAMFQQLEKHFEDHTYVITSIKDMYV